MHFMSIYSGFENLSEKNLYKSESCVHVWICVLYHSDTLIHRFNMLKIVFRTEQESIDRANIPHAKLHHLINKLQSRATCFLKPLAC